MKTSENNLSLWVEANRKTISKEKFLEQTGMDFGHFSDTYKRQCRKAWRQYLAKKSSAKPQCITKEREAHLLWVIDVWKQRYLKLKSPTP